MKIPTADNVKAVAMIGAGILVIYAAWKIKQGAVAVYDAGKEVVTKKLNPASSENLAYGSVNSILQTALNDKNATLGSKIYDWTHWD